MFLTNLLKFTTKKRYNSFVLDRNEKLNPVRGLRGPTITEKEFTLSIQKTIELWRKK